MSQRVKLSKKWPSTGAQACKSRDHNQSRGRQIWHLLRASLYFIELSCLVAYLMRMSPLYADFALQMLFCWDCQLQIACGNTSSMQQINTYTIIAYPCYCHDCKQLIKGMYLLCLTVTHSSHIFSTFKSIDFLEHLASFHLTSVVLLCHHLNRSHAVCLHMESAPQVRIIYGQQVYRASSQRLWKHFVC